MDREHMREICVRGRGSRGGKGAWARKNPGKTRTRRSSLKEDERKLAEWAVVQKELRKTLTKRMSKGAERLLKGKRVGGDANTPAKFWESVVASQQTYIPKARELHRRAVEEVYSLLIKIADEGLDHHLGVMQEHYTAMMVAAGRNPGSKSLKSIEEIVRMIVRLRLKFDHDGDATDYQPVWRVVKSITNLLAKRISPDQVKDLPGGIDDWCRSSFKGFRTAREVKAEAKALSTDLEGAAKALDYLDDVAPPSPRKNARDVSDLERVVAMHSLESGLKKGGFMLLGVLADPNDRHSASLELRHNISNLRTFDPDKLREAYYLIQRIAERVLSRRASTWGGQHF